MQKLMTLGKLETSTAYLSSPEDLTNTNITGSCSKGRCQWPQLKVRHGISLIVPIRSRLLLPRMSSRYVWTVEDHCRTSDMQLHSGGEPIKNVRTAVLCKTSQKIIESNSFNITLSFSTRRSASCWGLGLWTHELTRFQIDGQRVWLVRSPVMLHY